MPTPLRTLHLCLLLGSAASCAAQSHTPGIAREAPPAPDLNSESQGPGSTRQLIKTVWLMLEVDDDGNARALLNERAGKLALSMGGYVSFESSQRFTLRVPAAKLEQTLAALNGFAPVLDEHHRVDDVTRRVRDLAIRIKNAKRLNARLLELVAETDSVTEILAVEKELARVTERLETLEAEMRSFSQRVALATIEVGYEDDVSPGPLGWVFYGLYRGVKWLFVWD